MRRNVIETIMGAAVLLVAGIFVVFAFSSTGMGTVDGYRVTAAFDNAQGITSGTDVRMSGVKIGSVVTQRLNPKTYFAEVTMSIDESIELPADTSARVVPEGLLGGNYINLEPGGAQEMIPEDGRIQYTQGAVNLMDMIGRMMFSGGQGSGGQGSGEQSGGQSGGVPGVPQ